MSTPSLQALVDLYIADPSPVRREAAVLAGVPLVRSILGKVSVPDHPLASYEDLEGAGLVGLIEALNNYDPGAGTAFMTYAYLRVRGAVVDYLRSLDVLSLGKRQRVAEAGAAAEALRQELGAEPSDRQVAERLGVELGDYDRLMGEAQARFALSLDAPIGDEGASALHDVVADGAAGERFASAEHADALGQARAVIAGLPSRTRAMVGMYYDDELTLREIGEVFSVSEARVSQILGKTMLAIRTRIEATAGTAA